MALNAKRFLLPASRHRAWGIFLKQGDGSEDMVGNAASRITALQMKQHEQLAAILKRCNDSKSAKPHKQRSPSLSNPDCDTSIKKQAQGWPKKHGSFAKKARLSQEDLHAEDLIAFRQLAEGTLGQREIDATCLRLAELKKKGSLEDWREAPHLIITVGASLKRIEICQLAFPCVLPKMRYALLCNGEVTLATGPMCLAMQGVQRQELVELAQLLKLSGTRQQDLAGNAFAANVCAAVTLAVLLAI